LADLGLCASWSGEDISQNSSTTLPPHPFRVRERILCAFVLAAERAAREQLERTSMRIELPVANGLRTDHPVPNLPFVDDSHLPIHDGAAVEANGRHEYNAGGGRYDRDRGDERRWSAFTNDQFNLDFSWLVRHDPGYGRTVLLYVDGDDAIMHQVSPREGDPLLHRAGGYWWDGTNWHRPPIIYDRSTGMPVVVQVPDAASITAADYLATHPGIPGRGRLVDITTFTPGEVGETQWAHDLSRWAARRPADGRPLELCIVDVAAPELDRKALVSKSGAAREVGLARTEIDEAIETGGGGRAERFPFPQWHTPRTRAPRWSKPVLREWSWERQRAHPEPVVAHLRRGESDLGAGALVHTDALVYTIKCAALWEMQQPYRPGPGRPCSLGPPLERLLGWIVAERPHLAEAVFADIVRGARQELDLPDDSIAEALRDAVRGGIDSNDEDGAVDEFLRRTLPPSLIR